jgi:hypothetical protein
MEVAGLSLRNLDLMASLHELVIVGMYLWGLMACEGNWYLVWALMRRGMLESFFYGRLNQSFWRPRSRWHGEAPLAGSLSSVVVVETWKNEID